MLPGAAVHSIRQLTQTLPTRAAALGLIVLAHGCSHKYGHQNIGEPVLADTTLDPLHPSVQIADDGADSVTIHVQVQLQEREIWEQTQRRWEGRTFGVARGAETVAIPTVKDTRVLPSGGAEVSLLLPQGNTVLAESTTDKNGVAEVSLRVPDVPPTVIVRVGAGHSMSLDLSGSESYCRSVTIRLQESVAEGDSAAAILIARELGGGHDDGGSTCPEANQILVDSVVGPLANDAKEDGGRALQELIRQSPSLRRPAVQALGLVFSDQLRDLVAHELTGWTARTTIAPEEYLGGGFANWEGSKTLWRSRPSVEDPVTGWNSGDRMLVPLLRISELGEGDLGVVPDSDLSDELETALRQSLVACAGNPRAMGTLITPSGGALTEGFGGPGYSTHKFGYRRKGTIESVDGRGGTSPDTDLATCIQANLPKPPPPTRYDFYFTATIKSPAKLHAVRQARTCLAAAVDVVDALQSRVPGGHFGNAQGEESLQATLQGLTKTSETASALSPKEVAVLSRMVGVWRERIDAVERRWGLTQDDQPPCILPAHEALTPMRGALTLASAALSSADQSFWPQVSEATTWLVAENPTVMDIGAQQYESEVAAGLVCEVVTRRNESGCDKRQHLEWTRQWCATTYSPIRERYGDDVSVTALERMCRPFASFSGGAGPLQQYTGYTLNGRAIEISPFDCVEFVSSWCGT